MSIAIIADQHGTLPLIPQCDLMVVSGDMCGGPDHDGAQWRSDLSDGRWREWLQNEFMDWARQAPRAIIVGGNHDTCLTQGRLVLPPTVFYLCDSGVEIGGLRFWGAPWVKKWDMLAFNLSEPELEEKWAMIPADTDIVVCHGPPFGAGDYVANCGPQGSPSLRAAIERIQPKLVTCGHIHEGRGEYRIGNTSIINAAGGFVEVEL